MDLGKNNNGYHLTFLTPKTRTKRNYPIEY